MPVPSTRGTAIANASAASSFAFISTRLAPPALSPGLIFSWDSPTKERMGNVCAGSSGVDATRSPCAWISPLRVNAPKSEKMAML